MSFAAAHESKDVRRVCERCRDRKARFHYRGRVRADRHHTLCFECFRSERDRQRARRLTQVPASPLRINGAAAGDSYVVSGFSRTSLSARQRAHRRQMLAHLVTAGAMRTDGDSASTAALRGTPSARRL